MRGGGGIDTITYATRTNPVSVTVGVTEGDDGEAGEGDTASSDVEIIRGGRGDDSITGGPGPEELYGRAGNDVLDGGDGAGDLLDGGDGNDIADRRRPARRPRVLRRRVGPLQRRSAGPDRRLRRVLRDRRSGVMRRLTLATALFVALAAPAQAAKKPDLTITKAATAGTTVNFTVAAKGANAGKSTTGLVLSTDAKFDKADKTVATAAQKAIKAKKTATGKLTADACPNGLAAGRYTVLVCADVLGKVKESSETNNCKAAGTVTRVRAGGAHARGARTAPPPAPNTPAAPAPITNNPTTTPRRPSRRRPPRRPSRSPPSSRPRRRTSRR